MKKILQKMIMIVSAAALLVTTSFAIEAADVESAIASSGKNQVSGNIFIWFLCAVGFLKISQKIDSFMSGLGINVGRTGGSMLGELMVAGRAIGGAVKAVGGGLGNVFSHNHSSVSTTNQAAGQSFSTGGGIAGVAKRAAGNAAVSSVTGKASTFGSFVGGAMFGSSMNSGGRFAADVISTIARGNISSVGSMTGDKAAEALTSYLGYSAVAASAADAAGERTEEDVTLNGAVSPVNSAAVHTEDGSSIPAAPPTFRDVEIGGGRITGYETPAGGGEERQFAMYHAGQYLEPSGSYETVETADGESWYRQYAAPVVEKTPYSAPDGRIRYNEKIVQEMPQVPKRKDRV